MLPTDMNNLKVHDSIQQVYNTLVDLYGKEKTGGLIERAGIIDYFLVIEKSEGMSNSRKAKIKSQNIPKTEYLQMLLAAADIFREYGLDELSIHLYGECIRYSSTTSGNDTRARAFLHRGNLFSTIGKMSEAKNDYQKSKIPVASLSAFELAVCLAE